VGILDVNRNTQTSGLLPSPNKAVQTPAWAPLFLSDRCGSSTTVNPLLLAPESLAQPGRESGMRLDPVGADPEGVAFEYEVPE
jgi:hypothetical protein